MEEAFVSSEVCEGDDITVIQFDFRESELTAERVEDDVNVSISYSNLNLRELVIPEGDTPQIVTRVERTGSDDPTKSVLLHFD